MKRSKNKDQVTLKNFQQESPPEEKGKRRAARSVTCPGGGSPILVWDPSPRKNLGPETEVPPRKGPGTID